MATEPTPPPKNWNLLRENEQLMVRMGSKMGSDPIPPSVYRRLKHRVNCSQQCIMVIAWLLDNTIRYRQLPEGAVAARGGRDKWGRCHYAIDVCGNALYVADMAREYSWDTSNANRYWNEMEKKTQIGFKDARGPSLSQRRRAASEKRGRRNNDSGEQAGRTREARARQTHPGVC